MNYLKIQNNLFLNSKILYKISVVFYLLIYILKNSFDCNKNF